MPGTRRPPSHTALAGAPKLAELFGSLAQMLAGRVVIGQNIRFDLAVLRHEAARADQRSLVRDLRVLDDTLRVLRSSIAGQAAGRLDADGQPERTEARFTTVPVRVRIAGRDREAGVGEGARFRIELESGAEERT